MKRWQYNLIMFLLGSTTVLLLGILVLSVWPYDILEIPTEAALVSTTVKKGTYIEYIGIMRKKMALPSVQDCYFVDSIKYSLPQRTTNRAPGYYDEIVPIVLPKELPLNEELIYQCDIVYHPNPFRTVTYTWHTVPFTIVE